MMPKTGKYREFLELWGDCELSVTIIADDMGLSNNTVYYYFKLAERDGVEFKKERRPDGRYYRLINRDKLNSVLSRL